MKCPMMISLGAALAIPAALSSAQHLPSSTTDCTVTYADAAAWDDAVDRAGRDIRSCVAANRIAPRVARRGLSALSDLRDLYAYDRRRAVGTRSERRDGIYLQRLHAVMSRTLPAGVATGIASRP